MIMYIIYMAHVNQLIAFYGWFETVINAISELTHEIYSRYTTQTTRMLPEHKSDTFQSKSRFFF